MRKRDALDKNKMRSIFPNLFPKSQWPAHAVACVLFHYTKAAGSGQSFEVLTCLDHTKNVIVI